MFWSKTNAKLNQLNTMIATADKSSLSNFESVKTTHTHLKWTIDWTAQIIHGSATLTLEPTSKDANPITEVILDTSFLSISSVQQDGQDLTYTLAEHIEAMGSALNIQTLAQTTSAPFTLTIHYSTTSSCTALGWLTPEQTKGGRHPYLYSQCQAIHARSLLPCQDTPAIKATYSAEVVSVIPVLMSALLTSPTLTPSTPSSPDETLVSPSSIGKTPTIYKYDQPVPVPSYLIAIAAGDVVHRSFERLEGKEWRCGVWTEKEVMEDAFWEFSEDTANFVATAEKWTSPYVWGVYDILLLPASFPFGGMENACLTFVTPTLLAKDRSLVDVCAHEISHSWFGNGIGCANWDNFWLNEGWTTYLERLVVGDTYGPAHRDLSYIIGRKSLKDSLKEMPAKYQSLVIDYALHGDPDDGFSSIPYDKGSNFLLKIERQLGGLDVFRPYIKAYVQEFSGKSITTDQWKSHLYSYFGQRENGRELTNKLDALDWRAWLHGTGPDLPEDMTYDETLVQQSYDLARRWIETNEQASGFDKADIKYFSASQIIVFLEKLQDLKKFSAVKCKALDKTYGFGESSNAELASRFFELALSEGDEYAAAAAVWVTDKGRMKFCRPIYRAIYKVAPKLAQSTFKAHAGFYHPIARKMVAKDLGVDL